MNRAGFILAMESYLLRKGLVTVLNHIPGTMVLREFNEAAQLIEFLRKEHTDYLMVSQSIFENVAGLFISEPVLLDKTILVTDLPPERVSGNVQASIHPGEGKEVITGKIMKILDSKNMNSAQISSFELTPREKTIVRLVSMGYTNKQIAEQLFLSTHTVITHRKNISNKLGIKSASGLTIYAIVNNIITIEEVTSKPAR